ncbi:MAG TPA: SDR family NAD(P)-dependent oxidoreductase [Verrucomicrobiae bacterium]|nr:SDR family NAD(P)-dependent oxidoreductase [Verrucomicrobiae bacterium]
MERAVIVSGASSGIGAAAVQLLAGRGFVVFAGVRSEADAQRSRAVHANVSPVLLDVTDPQTIARAIEAVKARGVALVGVVSNAGIALGGPLERFPIDELRRQFEVNVFGALALAQAALPLVPRRQGRIVFVGSIAGRLPTPYIGPYSASKFALRALADALRVELAPDGIAVSLIEPGSVKTPIWKKGREARGELFARLGPDARPHYAPALERLLEATRSEERTGLPVEVVSEAILHALTSAKPRASYLLGAPARMGSVVAMLPAGTRSRFLRAVMKLP